MGTSPSVIRAIVAAGHVQDWTVPARVAVAGPIGHGKSTVSTMLNEKFGHVQIAFADHLRHVCNVLLGVSMERLTDQALKGVPLVGFENGYIFPFDKLDPRALNAQLDMAMGVAYGVDPMLFTNALSTGTHRDMVKVGASQLLPSMIRRGVLTEFFRHIWVPLRNGKIFTPREIMQLVGTEVFRTVDPPIWVWAWSQQVEEHGMAVAPDLRFPNEAEQVREMQGICIQVSRPGQEIDAQHSSAAQHSSERQLDGFDFDFMLVNDGSLQDLWDGLREILHIYADLHKPDVDSGYAKLITA